MRLRAVLLSVLVLTVAVGPAVAADHTANRGNDDPGPRDGWTNTTTVNKSDISGNGSDVLYEENETVLRVEESHADSISVTVPNASSNLSMSINITENATNVTFYLQKDVVESNVGNVSDVTTLLDGNETDWYVDEDAGPGKSPWILFEIPEFSERQVTFESAQDGGPDGSISDDGLPPGVDEFLSTTPLTGDDAGDLSGKVRVSDEQTTNLSTSVVENSESTTEIEFDSDLDTPTTVYIQSSAVESVVGDDIVVAVDGEPTNSTLTDQANSSWIVFEIDGFSTKTVTFTSGGGGGLTSFSLSDLAVIGLSLAAAGFVLLYLGRRREVV